MNSLLPAAPGLFLLLCLSAAGAQAPPPPKAQPPKAETPQAQTQAPPSLAKELEDTFQRLKDLLGKLNAIRSQAMGTAAPAQRAALEKQFQAVRDEFLKTRKGLLGKVEKAKKAYPSDPGVAKVHIQFALGRKDWKTALADSDVLVKAHPENKDYLGQRAFLLLQLGRLEETIAQLRRLRKVTGDPTQEAPLLVQCLANLGRYEDALAEIAAFRKAKKDPSALAQLEADCLFQLHRWKEAEKAAEKALASLRDRMSRVRNPQEARGLQAGIQQTQRLLQAAKDYPAFLEEEKKLEKAQAEKKDNPLVAIETNRGEIVVELFEDSAPNTVANFIELAEKKFYDGTRFHRVIPGFMIQGGDPNSKDADPSNDGMGGPGYRFADECRNPGARKHFAGSISMANSGPDTNGSQFFITHTITWHLNGRHTVFGRVVKGMDVVRSIRKGDVIERVKVLRKRDHPYKVKKMK